VKGLSAAELILKDLGITDPKEIDLEAIAWTLGVRVKYRPLQGCEACIAGDLQRAIMTVNSRSAPRRRRFSLGHELGHWKYHRGRILVCRAEEIGGQRKGQSPLEREADRFAADLLLPLYLLKPAARQFAKLNVHMVSNISDMFETSLTATAIRLVETGLLPAILVCHGPEGRVWFTRSPDIPARWFPQEDLDTESSAFGILFANHADDRMPRKIGADAWFDRAEAQRYEILEQTVRTGGQEILSLILFQDEGMLEETEHRR
jgi:Zn-dependent peptidase ImmA (M78 family)